MIELQTTCWNDSMPKNEYPTHYLIPVPALLLICCWSACDRASDAMAIGPMLSSILWKTSCLTGWPSLEIPTPRMKRFLVHDKIIVKMPFVEYHSTVKDALHACLPLHINVCNVWPSFTRVRSPDLRSPWSLNFSSCHINLLSGLRPV